MKKLLLLLISTCLAFSESKWEVVDDNFSDLSDWHLTLANVEEADLTYDLGPDGLHLRDLKPLQDESYTSLGLLRRFEPLADFNFQAAVSWKQVDRSAMPMIKLILYSKGKIVASLNHEDRSWAGYGYNRVYSTLHGWNRIDTEPARDSAGVWEVDRRGDQVSVWWEDSLFMSFNDRSPIDEVRVYLQGFNMKSARWPWSWQDGSHLAIHSLKISDDSHRAPPVEASIKVPSIFSDGMVIQREKPFTMWGWTSPQTEVEVSFSGRKARTVSSETGHFQVTLPSLPASSEPRELTIKTKRETFTIYDVLVGEVWLMSGQSNMEWLLGYTNAISEVENLEQDPIRISTVSHQISDTPLEDPDSRWLSVKPDTIGGLSAFAFHYAVELQKSSEVPVGIIVSAWGGTRIEAWMPRGVLEARHQGLLSRWQKDREEYDPDTMHRQMNPDLAYHRPSGAYNGMIAPIAPFSVRGIVWYQGESNVSRAEQYADLLPDMIHAWRKAWNLPNLPFLVVQLPNYGTRSKEPRPSEWAELRAAQAEVLDLPNTGLIVTIDIGSATDLHPDNKATVARRTMMTANDLVYENGDGMRFPMLKKTLFSNGQGELTFSDDCDLWLTGDSVEASFAVAGDDRVFYVADEVSVEANKLYVSSAQVPDPVAVRYAWDFNPEAVLFDSRTRLPAAPFRTDAWPLTTLGRE